MGRIVCDVYLLCECFVFVVLSEMCVCEGTVIPKRHLLENRRILFNALWFCVSCIYFRFRMSDLNPIASIQQSGLRPHPSYTQTCMHSRPNLLTHSVVTLNCTRSLFLPINIKYTTRNISSVPNLSSGHMTWRRLHMHHRVCACVRACACSMAEISVASDIPAFRVDIAIHQRRACIRSRDDNNQH